MRTFTITNKFQFAKYAYIWAYTMIYKKQHNLSLEAYKRQLVKAITNHEHHIS